MVRQDDLYSHTVRALSLSVNIPGKWSVLTVCRLSCVFAIKILTAAPVCQWPLIPPVKLLVSQSTLSLLMSSHSSLHYSYKMTALREIIIQLLS